MAENPDGIPALIKKIILRDVRRAISPPDPELDYTFRIDPPVPATTLPTFDKRKRRPMTPMLRERFNFASSITVGGKIWLGSEEMVRMMGERRIREYHLALREHGEGTAPNLYPDDALSLFSVSPEFVEDRVYLVWKERAPEPEFWLYSGIDSLKFKSLKGFLKWHLA
jgi:hypothetical protein